MPVLNIEIIRVGDVKGGYFRSVLSRNPLRKHGHLRIYTGISGGRSTVPEFVCPGITIPSLGAIGFFPTPGRQNGSRTPRRRSLAGGVSFFFFLLLFFCTLLLL